MSRGRRGAAPPLALAPRRGPAGLLRPKGHLSRTALWGLGILASLPLLSVLLRTLAFSLVPGPGLDAIRGLGLALEQWFSLSDVPSGQREQILYLLCLPTCALLVALARLTFGIRVLGFRSILIAVGFHQSGIVPSLLLIAVAVTTIVMVRPWLRRIRLPYYGRVSVILCVVATTMVGALLAGPWMRSDVVWGVAFFPVIVLGMLAEGIAHTLDRGNVVTAVWRAITTVLLAFLIALVCWVPALRSTLLQFPELVLTQIVAIVMISEFLDYRLFQGWDLRVAARLFPQRRRAAAGLPVAVVCSASEGAGVGRGPGRRLVRRTVRALRSARHVVRVFEHNASLPRELRRFLPPDGPRGTPHGLVLPLTGDRRGGARLVHLAALLESSGISYVGPAAVAQATMHDRLATRLLLREAAVPIPAFRVMAGPGDDARGLRFPVWVRPRREPGAMARRAADQSQLHRAVRWVVRRYRQEALVEEVPDGRRITAALLGNDPVECLPLVERPRAGEKLCPAVLDLAIAERIRACAEAAARACGCRDYAGVELCLSPAGDVRVLEVRNVGLLAGGGAFARAAEEAGYTFTALIARIVEVARARANAGEPSRPTRQPRREPAVAPGTARSGGPLEPGRALERRPQA